MTSTASTSTNDGNSAVWSTAANPQTATTAWTGSNFEQYYNYYQAVPPPVTPVTVTRSAPVVDPTTATSQVDYSKAWDEYYKAYYGQNYAQVSGTYATTATTQYPYSYDQYSAYNASYAAPPPNYYQNTPNYVQPETSGAETTTTYSSYAASTPSYSYPATTNWNQPPPDYSQTAYSLSYNVPNSNTYTQSEVNTPGQQYTSTQSEPQYTGTNYDYNKGKDVTNQIQSRDVDQSYRSQFPPPFNQKAGSRGRGRGKPRFDNSEKFEQGQKVIHEESNNTFTEPESFNPNSNTRGRGSYRGRGDFGRPPLTQKPDTRPGQNNMQMKDYNLNGPRYTGPRPRMVMGEESFDDGNQIDAMPNRNSSYAPRGRGGPRPGDPRLPAPKSFQPPEIPDLMKMDIDVSLSSPIIKRRQSNIDAWQAEVSKMPKVNSTLNNLWASLKQCLSPELQGMFHAVSYHNGDEFSCELFLDDIFLSNGVGTTNNAALQEAAKECWNLLNKSAFVIPCFRIFEDEKIPGFCISEKNCQPILPPLLRQSYNGQITEWENKPETECPTDLITQPNINTQDDVEDQLFVVVDESTTERDYSISVLMATAKFNEVAIEFKHEKKPHAPHISQCIIILDGTELGRSEARDYLFAKRQAADKVLNTLKKIKNVVSLRLDKARLVHKQDLNSEIELKDAIREYLMKNFTESDDILLRIGSDFSLEERNSLIPMLSEFNLTYKNDQKCIFIFKQYTTKEMKEHLLKFGVCGQYRLVEKVVFE